MFFLAVCFAAGVLSAKLTTADLRAALAVCVAAAIFALIFRGARSAVVFVAILFASAGAVSFWAEKAAERPDRLKLLYDNGTIRSGSPVEVEGVLLGRPEPSVEGAFLTFRADGLTEKGSGRPVTGNVRLFVPVQDDAVTPISDLKYGSRIRVAVNLEREDEFLNPGVVPRREMLDRLGIDATGSVKSPVLIEHIADESVFIPLAWVFDQRVNLIDDLRKNLGRPAAGVMIASLLGDKYFLDKETADLFREGGTFHILVISGLHITFIGGMLLLFIRQLTRNRWLQFGVTVGTLWAYTLAIGADVPVVRASIMFTIVLFAYAVYRRGTLINSLGACSLILLVWRPSDLFNPSFQLTFVSVGAIVGLAYPLVETLQRIGSWTPSAKTPFPPNVPGWLRRVCETLYWRPVVWSIESKRQVWTANVFKSPYLAGRIGDGIQRSLRFTFEGIAVSAIVQIAMLPLSVVYFHRVSVASILLNLWVGVLIAVESFAVVAGAVISHVSGHLAAPLFVIGDAVNWLMLAVPRLAANVNWASFRLPDHTGAGRALYFVFFVPVLMFAVAAHRWRPFEVLAPSPVFGRTYLLTAAFLLTTLTAVIVFHPFSAPRPDGRLHLDVIDVGQGDAALITFPDGRTMLVDGGGRFDYRKADDESEAFEPDTRTIGEAVVSEVLWEKGYSAIDHIVATHADADHVQGLTDVARNFRVGSALFGRLPADDRDFADLADVLRRRGVPVEVIARGDVLKFGDVTVEVLFPIAASDPNSAYDNNSSAVLRIVYGSRTILLTGDVEQAAENALLSGGGNLRADLVKVPHHGSRTSSTQGFIDAVGAEYAVISVGRESPFGHPHKDVVERWRSSGASVMTTGERGMISVSTDGADLRVSSFLP